MSGPAMRVTMRPMAAGTRQEELEEIVEQYRHARSEHQRAGREGRVRRHLKARLDELEERFERLLALLPLDEQERAAWRARLHDGPPLPSPVPAEPTLLFRGRSQGGSVIEIRADADRGATVMVDGVPVERLVGEPEGGVFELGDQSFEEVFEASPEAREALGAWVFGPAGPPPWEHAAELIADGLVDRHFGLTARGRRAVQGPAA